jgi:hypothetical protein
MGSPNTYGETHTCKMIAPMEISVVAYGRTKALILCKTVATSVTQSKALKVVSQTLRSRPDH